MISWDRNSSGGICLRALYFVCSSFLRIGVVLGLYGAEKLSDRGWFPGIGVGLLQGNWTFIIKKDLLWQVFDCGRLDLNQHSLATTSPSSWRVYQFHHYRNFPCIIPTAYFLVKTFHKFFWGFSRKSYKYGIVKKKNQQEC